MNRRPQTDFIDITTATATAANHLAADILSDSPTTLPGPDDALLTLSMYKAMHGAQAVDAEIRAEIAADDPYSPPQGIPDAYRSTDTYRPSQGIVDALGPSPLERLEMQQLSVRTDGLRLRIEPDTPRLWTDVQREQHREAMGSAGILALAVACAILLTAFAIAFHGAWEWFQSMNTHLPK